MIDKKPFPEPVVVYQQGPVRIDVKQAAEPAAVDLLKRTVYGTNGVQYQHTGQEHKVTQLINPYFFHLFYQNDLIGIYCLDERPVNLSGDLTVRGFYGRYLSVDPDQQHKGYGRLLKAEAVRYVETYAKAPYLLYSYIEERNVRSLLLSEREGFTSVAHVKTFIFRRYAPTTDPRFTRLAAADNAPLLAQLERFYDSHALTTFTRMGFQNNYFVLKEGNAIIAGVQANPVRWNFSNMPGFSGWLMMHVFPLSSITRRFFNPNQYQFAALEGLYWKPGRESVVPALLESVLAHFGFHSVLLEVDTRDPLNALITDAKQMGPLSGFQSGIITHVLVKASSPELLTALADKPVYVSSFDFS